MSTREEILNRYFLISLLFLIMGLVIICRIFWLQFSDQPELKAYEAQTKPQIRNTIPHRGDILSRDGKKLAVSIPNYQIYLDYQVINNLLAESDTFDYVNDFIKNVSKIIKDKSQSEYKGIFLKGLNKGGKIHQYYPFITSSISYDQRKRLQKASRLASMPANKGGVIIKNDFKRIYPYGNLAARTIGRTGTFNYGLDHYYNTELKGIEGMFQIKRIFDWNLSETTYEGKDGSDITTTIDIDIQEVASRSLTDMLKKQDAPFGCAIVMDVKTGEVLAMSNIERYKNGTYGEGGTNYATNYRSTPGSTFKLASMIALLEAGVINVNDSINTGDGSYKYPSTSKVYRDTHANHWLTPKGIMANSSNIGIIKMVSGAFRNNPKTYVDRIFALGLNNRLGIDLEEIDPKFKYPYKSGESWYSTDLPSMSIGYVEELAPIQILSLYNAVANNGTLVRPRFVRNVSYNGTIEETFFPEVINQAICSKKTIDIVKNMLEEVVLNGTAKNIRSDKYKIAGKTGTIEINEVVNTPKGNIIKVEHQASFCGYFPAEDPKYSCIVVVNKPQLNKYGGTIAAVVFKQISDYIYLKDPDMHEAELIAQNANAKKIPYSKSGNREETIEALKKLKIPIQTNNSKAIWIDTKRMDKSINFANRNYINGVVPNVVGMGLKDAVFCMEKAGLDVSIIGEHGAVKSQSLVAGSIINNNKKVKLTLQ